MTSNVKSRQTGPTGGVCAKNNNNQKPGAGTCSDTGLPFRHNSCKRLRCNCIVRLQTVSSVSRQQTETTPTWTSYKFTNRESAVLQRLITQRLNVCFHVVGEVHGIGDGWGKRTHSGKFRGLSLQGRNEGITVRKGGGRILRLQPTSNFSDEKITNKTYRRRPPRPPTQQQWSTAFFELQRRKRKSRQNKMQQNTETCTWG